MQSRKKEERRREVEKINNLKVFAQFRKKNLIHLKCKFMV